MTPPFTFVEFTEDQFPIHVTMYRGDAVVWKAAVTEPGALQVPALGDVTRCLVQLADGSVYDTAGN